MGQFGFYQAQRKKKVLIIGAGIAGMKVAHTLAKHNIDFCLIEYSDYMGGRIRHA
jgi:monoamine oxidase